MRTAPRRPRAPRTIAGDSDAQRVLDALWRACLPLPLSLDGSTYLAAVTDEYLCRATGLNEPHTRAALVSLTTDAQAVQLGTLTGPRTDDGPGVPVRLVVLRRNPRAAHRYRLDRVRRHP